jgi:urease accessory protein
MTELSTMRLWQLISPALPVGAYAYSGGLESAIEAGLVEDLDSAQNWLEGLLRHALAKVDLPLFLRLYDAWQTLDMQVVDALTRQLQAMRETRELLNEDKHMGAALRRLLIDLQVPDAALLQTPSFATSYALACHHWQISCESGALGLAWSWVENQVAASIKLIPLGQTDGQRLLGNLLPAMQDAVDHASLLADDELGCSLPGLAILSAQHEQQYSRLFRS